MNIVLSKDEISRLAVQGWWLSKLGRYYDIKPASMVYWLRKYRITCQHVNAWATGKRRKRTRKPCVCGCGKLANLGKSYCHGHNPPPKGTKEFRERCSESQRKRYPPGHLVHCGWCFKPLRKVEWEMMRGNDHHYCDRKCEAKHQVELRKGSNSHFWKGGMETRACAECGKPVTRHPSNFKGICFCSDNCDRLWRIKNVSGPLHPQWQGGISYQTYCSGWKDAEYKDDLKNRDCRICALCGESEKLRPHHIDYDKKNCKPRNLITLCNRCNSKVNFKREFWRAYFERLQTFGKVQRLSFLGVGPSGPKCGETRKGL